MTSRFRAPRSFFVVLVALVGVWHVRDLEADPLLDKTGHAIWVSEGQIRAVLTDHSSSESGSVDGVSGEVAKAVRETVDKLLDWYDYHAKVGNLDADGCLPIGPTHYEQQDARLEGLTPLAELVERADDAVVVNVTRVEQGFEYRELKTRVTVELINDLSSRAGGPPAGEVFWFDLRSVSFRFGDKLICQERRDLEQPRVGENLLLLGRLKDRSAGHFLVANYFEVKNGAVVRLPYVFVDPESERSIARLSETRRSSQDK
ncbi:MAG: hypothetical protein KDD11_13570 [Acidobacteria bacterium]|nr:hypothetical protein [Acidobacteriota bacterium]